MATIKLADGRGELYQWDTGRKVVIDDESIKRVHYQNRFYGRTVDVDVSSGFAIIPDRLLQSCSPLVVFAWSGNPDDGYTKIEKTFEVNRRNMPSDYVFTPVDQKTLDDLQEQIGDLSTLQTTTKDNLVAAINEVALAVVVKGTFYVTVTQGDDNSATADKTAAEVYAAYAAGYAVYALEWRKKRRPSILRFQ